MSHSKRLAVATSDRMITFYSLDGSTKKTTEPPKSRIEDLPAVPLCLEYIKHNTFGMDLKKSSGPDGEKKALETLIWGDDLGIITKYDFHETNWHICNYKAYSKKDRNYLTCCEDKIVADYHDRQWQHDALYDIHQQYLSLTAEERVEEGQTDNHGAAAAQGTG